MKLAQFTSGTHNPRCSGCPVCSEECAAVFRMPTHEYARWLTEQNAQLRSSYASLRTHIRVAVASDDAVPPPPSLAASIRAARANGPKTPRRTPWQPVAPPQDQTRLAVSVARGEVPPPPDLAAAIRAARARGAR